jgi:ketosteroid isomerase-like protein
MSEQSLNERVVRGVYEASARGDVAAIVAAQHPKAVWELPPSAPYGGVLAGHGPVREYLSGLYARLGRGLRSELDGVSASDERVLAQGWYVSETPRVRFVDLWQLRDGQVVRRVLSFDTATGFARLTGLLDREGPAS